MPKGKGRGRGRPKGSSLQKKVNESANGGLDIVEDPSKVLEVVQVDTGFEEVQEADSGMQEKKGRGRPKRSRVQISVQSVHGNLNSHNILSKVVVEESSGCNTKESVETGHTSSDIEAHLSELRSPLPSELRSILLSFLASHPAMLLYTSPHHRGPAYMVLGEFLLFVGRHSLRALADSQLGEFLSLLNALAEFSFDSAWLERIRGQVISSSEDSPFQALSRISASREHVRARVERLSAEAIRLAKALEENDCALQECLNQAKALEEEESRIRLRLDAPLFRL